MPSFPQKARAVRESGNVEMYISIPYISSHGYGRLDIYGTRYIWSKTAGGRAEKAAADVKVVILANARATWFRWFPEIHRTLSISIRTQTSLFSQGLPP